MITPVWIYLLGPAATLVGIVVAFLLGRVQGRSQTRYVKSAEILTELRRIVLEIEMYLVHYPEEPDEGKVILGEKIKDHELELVRYLQTYALWLPRPTRDKVDAVLREFMRAYTDADSLDAKELTERLRALMSELAVETERLLGTGPPWWKPWLLTHSGRLKRYSV